MNLQPCGFCRGQGSLADITLNDKWVKLSGRIVCPVCAGDGRVENTGPRWGLDNPVWKDDGDRRNEHLLQAVPACPKPQKAPKHQKKKVAPRKKPVALPSDSIRNVAFYDPRSTTARMCGDPMPGRSALDRRSP